MKLPSSDDWKLETYFAEVKEIFGEKFYFCCPLESNENGIKPYLSKGSMNNYNYVIKLMWRLPCMIVLTMLYLVMLLLLLLR
jgi:hypothetical protein